ncbi:MAG: copper chaperone PCu(A)C [Ilumatobacteraceae bacterium]
MSRRIVLLAAAALLFTACGSESTAAPVTQLTATGAWARTTPPGATNGVVYVQVASPTDDAIVGAAVPAEVAGGAELHETMGSDGTSPMANMPEMATDGQMTMAPVDAVELPAGATVAFEPGGKHVMLTGLAAPLVAGATFTITFTLKSGASLPVEVTVADNAPE